MSDAVFSKDNLPGFPKSWPKFRKVALTSMIRVDGEFTVETREGRVTCKDGYLAVDAHGWPYPIAIDEQEKIYVKAMQ